jgi:hypothetical protein
MLGASWDDEARVGCPHERTAHGDLGGGGLHLDADSAHDHAEPSTAVEASDIHGPADTCRRDISHTGWMGAGCLWGCAGVGALVLRCRLSRTDELGRPSAVLCGGSVSGRGATTIQILVAVLPPRLSASPYLVINGLRLYTLEERSSGTLGYYSPALGSEVLGSGPLAGRILRTLTHSVESQPVVYEPAVI